MTLLETWTRGEHTAPVAGRPTTFPTYRKGTGPGVVVVHEIPGLTPAVIGFGEEVVAAGFTVVMPSLFGTPERPAGAGVDRADDRPGLRATRIHQAGAPPDLTGRGLAAQPGPLPARGARRARRGRPRHVLHRRLRARDDGGRAVAAPVLCPPIATSRSPPHAPPTSTSPPPTSTACARARRPGARCWGCATATTRRSGTRFETLTRELGDHFLRVEFPGKGHSTVTEHRQQEGVDRVLAFLQEKLQG